MLSSLNNHSAIDAKYPLLEIEPQPDKKLFPLYYQAGKIECYLTSGDMLYIPKGWWHWIFSESETITVNFWFNSVVTTINSVVKLDSIDRSISSNIYQQQYLNKHQPLLIKQAANNWQARNLWHQDYLAANKDVIIPKFYSASSINSSFAPVKKPYDVEINSSLNIRLFPEISFEQLASEIKQQSDLNHVAFIPFLDRLSLFSDCDLPQILNGRQLNSVNLWYSYGKIHTGLHFDDYENILVVVKGNKRIFLYPPSETKFLYSQSLPLLLNFAR